MEKLLEIMETKLKAALREMKREWALGQTEVTSEPYIRYDFKQIHKEHNCQKVEYSGTVDYRESCHSWRA